MEDELGTTHEELLALLRQDPEFDLLHRKSQPITDVIVEIINGRDRMGLTQKQLAKRAGTFQSRISRIESGEYDLRLSTLINIADALDSDVKIGFIPRYKMPESDLRELFEGKNTNQDVQIHQLYKQASTPQHTYSGTAQIGIE